MDTAVPRTRARATGGSLARREAIAFYVFISPWIIGFLVFTLGPMLASLYFSFTVYDVAHPPRWIGLANYRDLLTNPLFWNSIRVTLVYAVLALPIGLVLSIALALLLNMKLPWLSLWRTVYYLPSVISGVALALLWQLIFQPQFGLLNQLLGAIHIKGPQWQFSEFWVLPMFVIMSIFIAQRYFIQGIVISGDCCVNHNTCSTGR